MSGPLKYDYKKLKGDPADAPGLSSYIVGLALPIAGGTMAGNLDMDHYQISNVQAIDSDEITLNGLPVATEQFASNASNLTSGTVADARLSANVPLKNAANTFTANQTFGVAGTSNGQIVVGAAASVNAYITIAGSANNVVSGRNNILGVTWQIVTDASGSGGPASFRLGSTGSYGFGNASANVGTVDVSLVRNATGPTLETRAAGGLKVANADGSALAALACGTAQVGGRAITGGDLFQVGASGGAGWVYVNSSGTLVSVVPNNSAAYSGYAVIATGDSSGRMAFGLDNGRPFLGAGPGSSARDTFWNRASSGVWNAGTTESNALGSVNLANLNSSGVAKFTGYPTSLLPAAASNAGSITYDTTLSKHVGCNGSSWNALW